MKSLLQDKRGAVTVADASQKLSRACTPLSLVVNSASKLKDILTPQVGVSCQVLDEGSISKDVDVSPYWNKQCQAQQSDWFIPHQTNLREGSTKPLLNYGVKSSFWKKTFHPKDLISKPSSV